MKPKQDPTRRGEKTLLVHKELTTTGRPHTLTELSRKFGWSKQTILAIVGEIDRAYPGLVQRERRDKETVFQAKAESRQKVQLIGPDTVQSLLLCRGLSAAYLPEGLDQEIRDSILATVQLLRRPEKAAEATALEGRVTARGEVDYGDCSSVLEGLLEALSSNRVCTVSYRTPDREEVRAYAVAPRQLLAYRNALYLRCTYMPPDTEPPPDWDDMHLAVHRIQSLEVTDRTFEPRNDKVEPPEHFGFGLHPPIEVRIRFEGWAAHHVRERRWSRDQVLAEEAGGVVLTLTTTHRGELVTWIRGFGPSAEVLAPEDLREEMVESLRQSLRRYEEGLPSRGD